jgi:hypothetical protein
MEIPGHASDGVAVEITTPVSNWSGTSGRRRRIRWRGGEDGDDVGLEPAHDVLQPARARSWRSQTWAADPLSLSSRLSSPCAPREIGVHGGGCGARGGVVDRACAFMPPRGSKETTLATSQPRESVQAQRTGEADRPGEWAPRSRETGAQREERGIGSRLAVKPAHREADARARCVSDSIREGGCARGSWAEGKEGKWVGSVI